VAMQLPSALPPVERAEGLTEMEASLTVADDQGASPGYSQAITSQKPGWSKSALSIDSGRIAARSKATFAKSSDIER
jgi:hypothetical protein